MGITLKNNKSVTKNMTIKGDDGVGIKTITSGTPVVTEEKTTTPITVTLTDETTQNFNVEAKNGSGGEKLYMKNTELTISNFINTSQAIVGFSYLSKNNNNPSSFTELVTDITNSYNMSPEGYIFFTNVSIAFDENTETDKIFLPIGINFISDGSVILVYNKFEILNNNIKRTNEDIDLYTSNVMNTRTITAELI